jgi:hypothetical protein
MKGYLHRTILSRLIFLLQHAESYAMDFFGINAERCIVLLVAGETVEARVGDILFGAGFLRMNYP